MRFARCTLLALALTGCGPSDAGVDADADGYPEGEDCDDNDANRYPGARERCDDEDDDCDGSVDDEPRTAHYVDGDGDGYGDPTAIVQACAPSDGIVANGADCDDGDPQVRPGVEDRCDGVDDNCSGSEADAIDAIAYHVDGDGDGWGSDDTTLACSLPAGHAPIAGDCDDTRDSVNPDQTEVCNGRDDDCDGATDGPGAADAVTLYADGDGDGFGDSAETTFDCPADGFATAADDCDDRDPAVFPGADETCDGVDQDCDGEIDEEPVDSVWYSDADRDGYGDAATAVYSCTQPTGMVAELDCDDSDRHVNPDAKEFCDGIDNDCDGTVDEPDAVDATTVYADSDGDGYGDPLSTYTACASTSGYTADASDCDDSNATAHPGGTEVCDGADNDCDGTTDPDHLSLDFEVALAGELTLNGTASQEQTGSNGVLLLTSASAEEAGTAWYPTTVDGDSFYASFVFEASGGTGGQGLAFVFIDSTDDTSLGTADRYGVSGLSGYGVAFDTSKDAVVVFSAADGTKYGSAIPSTGLHDTGEHTVEIEMNAGVVDVWLDGAFVLSATITGYALSDVLIGVSGATTSTATDQHVVDDLVFGCP